MSIVNHLLFNSKFHENRYLYFLLHCEADKRKEKIQSDHDFLSTH